ncbi:S-adenosyl-L-methionine-dependent methyltransferase [Dichotomopilus funicola]|uniref:S-adenosyl-L-methionine-dependent methyltransferase n=1 Tax=Dichotomopilus funicola TaxID=1934379 RepID=A0AAN6V6L7_9PEZI|nr:S-adenosyl-L-methionine-dependent methyltransferase [Dichotomopilus funicola]
MEPYSDEPVSPLAPSAAVNSKKRSRAETSGSSPIEETAQSRFPPPKPAEAKFVADQAAPAGAKKGLNDHRDAQLEPNSSVLRRPSAVADDGASFFSHTDSAYSEPHSASVPVPGVPEGPRGSLSPPYMFTNPRAQEQQQTSNPEHGGSGDAEEEGVAEYDEQQEEEAAVAQAEDGSIVVDSDDLATDDGYGSDGNTTASTSLAESVRDYIFENGRRYHRFREGRYNFPNDDVEQQREDMKHAMVKMLCGQLHFAPIGDHPNEILDIGTGTGIWAIEMGDVFSAANVLGVDLSPIQPEWVPPNVRFMVDDIESPWLHPRNYFDYVHSRHTIMGIKDWPRLMRRCLEHLRPGGWFEMQEVFHFPLSASRTRPLPPDHPVVQYWTLINEGLTNLGITNFHGAANGQLAAMMRDVGFVNVTERVLQIPLGTWPKNKVLKTVGLYWRTILVDGMQAIALGPLTRGCGWTQAQVELFLTQVRRAYQDNGMLAYMPLHIVYGQKPEGY